MKKTICILLFIFAYASFSQWEPCNNGLNGGRVRRTFVTLSLEKGMRPETLMEITGHKDYKTFKKYIKISSNVKATEMNKIRNKEPVLKLVNF